MDLTDAHVLVTGACRGIGAGLAREFRGRGARVTLVASGKRHVRLPRRARAFAVLAETP